uniref:Uncharacterized protein n=1 Tax=Lepeophtheirus salmonis TaxID=72036 RepID=A0A0K2UF66_LEPSM
MRAHGTDLGLLHQTIQRALKKVGEKILLRMERPILTPITKEIHIFRYKTLLSSFELFLYIFGPYNPDPIIHDNTFWIYIEGKACSICHQDPQSYSLPHSMTYDYICSGCQAFCRPWKPSLPLRAATLMIKISQTHIYL